MPARKFIRLPFTRELLTRIFSKIVVSDTLFYEGEPCWIWTAATGKDGYAHLDYNGSKHQAHRTIYQLFVDDIAPELDADHLCRVRNCVNPIHIEPVVPKVNKLRGNGVMAQNARKTHCKRGHLLPTESNVPAGRQCFICRDMLLAERRKQHPENFLRWSRQESERRKLLPHDNPAQIKRREAKQKRYKELMQLPYDHPRRVHKREVANRSKQRSRAQKKELGKDNHKFPM